jgi:hypothetical protein
MSVLNCAVYCDVFQVLARTVPVHDTTSFYHGPLSQRYSIIVLNGADMQCERWPSSVSMRYDRLVYFYLQTADACRLDVVRMATGTQNHSYSLNSAFKIIKRFPFSSPIYYMRFLLSQFKYYWIVTYLLTYLLAYLLTYLLTYLLHGAESFFRG